MDDQKSVVARRKPLGGRCRPWGARVLLPSGDAEHQKRGDGGQSVAESAVAASRYRCQD